MDKTRPMLILIRIGLAFVFFYAAIASFIEPLNWIGYIPQFMRNIISGNILLPGFSIFEIILGLWILSGKKLFYSSLVASLTLFGIIIFSLNQFDVTFRDVSILLTALGLSAYSYKK